MNKIQQLEKQLRNARAMEKRATAFRIAVEDQIKLQSIAWHRRAAQDIAAQVKEMR